MKRIGNRVLAFGMILASIINITPMSHIYASSEKSLQNTNKIEAEMVKIQRQRSPRLRRCGRGVPVTGERLVDEAGKNGNIGA